jgi:hypothetical protein
MPVLPSMTVVTSTVTREWSRRRRGMPNATASSTRVPNDTVAPAGTTTPARRTAMSSPSHMLPSTNRPDEAAPGTVTLVMVARREECTVSSMRLPPPRGVWVTCAKLTRSRASAPFAGEGASGAEAARQAVRVRSALEVRAGDIFHSLERLRRVPSLVGVGQSEEPSLVEVVLQRSGEQTDEMGGILRNETDA